MDWVGARADTPHLTGYSRVSSLRNRHTSVTEGLMPPPDQEAAMKNDIETPHQSYFFKIYDDGVERGGADGLSFPSEKDAWHEACIATGEILRSMHDQPTASRLIASRTAVR